MKHKPVKKPELDKLILVDLNKHGLRWNLQEQSQVPIELKKYIFYC